MTTRRRGPVVLAIGTAILVGVLVAACSGSSPGTTPSAAASLPSSPTELPLFDGARFRDLLTTLRGKPVVINVWASWCGPCIEEAPDLARAARQFRGRVQFLGVDVLDQIGPARAFIRRFGWSYPSVFDPQAAIRNDLGFIGQPETSILDGSGRRVFTQSGPVTLEILSKELTDLA